MPVPLIQPTELYFLLQQNEPVLLLDVREPEEHELVKIDGSILVPLMELESRLAELRERIEQSRITVAYCRVGARSAMAIRWLAEQGIFGVKNLRGGINAYALEADRNLSAY